MSWLLLCNPKRFSTYPGIQRILPHSNNSGVPNLILGDQMKLLNVLMVSIGIFSVTAYGAAFDFIDRNASYQGYDSDPTKAGTQLYGSTTRSSIPPTGFVTMSSQNVTELTFWPELEMVIITHPNGSQTWKDTKPATPSGGATIIQLPTRSDRNSPYNYYVRSNYLKSIGESGRDSTRPFVVAKATNKTMYSDGSCVGSNCRRGYLVTCSSINSKYHFCPIDGLIADPYSYRVVSNPTVSDRLSTAKCKLNESYGSNSNGIWVDKGCGATFMVETKRVPRTIYMTCSLFDHDFKKVYCSLNGIVGMPVVDKQLSGKDCIAGKTYWYNEKGIWVDKGCQARFKVRVW